MSAQEWAARIQAVVQTAEVDGYDVEIVDDESCVCQRIEVRVSKNDDDALILEWNA